MYHTLPCKPIKLNYYQAHMYNADADCWRIKNRNIATTKFPDTQTYSIYFANIFPFFLCTGLLCYTLCKQKKKKDILLINAHKFRKINHPHIPFPKVYFWVDRTRSLKQIKFQLCYIFFVFYGDGHNKCSLNSGHRVTVWQNLLFWPRWCWNNWHIRLRKRWCHCQITWKVIMDNECHTHRVLSYFAFLCPSL